LFTKSVASGVLFSICELASPRRFALFAGPASVARTVKNACFLRGESFFETLASFSASDRGGGFRAAIG
jgi:hypothetical protein